MSSVPAALRKHKGASPRLKMPPTSWLSSSEENADGATTSSSRSKDADDSASRTTPSVPRPAAKCTNSWCGACTHGLVAATASNSSCASEGSDTKPGHDCDSVWTATRSVARAPARAAPLAAASALSSACSAEPRSRALASAVRIAAWSRAVKLELKPRLAASFVTTRRASWKDGPRLDSDCDRVVKSCADNVLAPLRQTSSAALFANASFAQPSTRAADHNKKQRSRPVSPGPSPEPPAASRSASTPAKPPPPEASPKPPPPGPSSGASSARASAPAKMARSCALKSSRRKRANCVASKRQGRNTVALRLSIADHAAAAAPAAIAASRPEARCMSWRALPKAARKASATTGAAASGAPPWGGRTSSACAKACANSTASRADGAPPCASAPGPK
mmetsp:Transcript_15179/g.53295  ORF Transcript_15179/g.53295 Transcript_15179/m.53295 type:complete len:394 (-) Transcript_15179:934-2115(-)